MPDTAKYKNIILNFLVPIICLGVSVILLLVIIYPSYKKLPALKEQLKSTGELRDQLKTKVDKLNKFKDYKSVLEQNSVLVDQVMPKEGMVPGLLDQVNKISDESGLSITKLSYSTADTNPDLDNKPSYSAVLVSLGADGTFDQMISFMKGIENASRLVNISNYRYSAVNVNEVTNLSFTFILSAPFMKVEASAVTDEPINLDLSGNDFVAFVNKIKSLRYFENSGELEKLKVKPIEQKSIDENPTEESTPSSPQL